MKQGNSDLSKIGVFLITSLVFILIGAIVLATQDKVEIHLAINSHHNSFFDFLFEYWTYLGDGIAAPIIVIILGIYFYKKDGLSPVIMGLGSLIMAGILSQSLKRIFFDDALRPARFIGEDQLYLVPDISMHYVHSFPSGHTTAGFAFLAFIAYMYSSENKLMQVILALVAVLIGYSRMYLSQHFLEDVVVGACLGLISFSFVFLIKRLVIRR